MNLLKEIKSHSSRWMKTRSESLQNFYWQNGYGAFSVTPAEVDVAVAYISRQYQHHDKKSSFQDEYGKLLKKYNMNYDER